MKVSPSRKVNTNVSGKPENTGDRHEKMSGFGLHFCGHYKNLVRYNAEFCARCPFNGLRDTSTTDPHP